MAVPTVLLNGETVHIVPLVPAHTNGDSAVKFEQDFQVAKLGKPAIERNSSAVIPCSSASPSLSPISTTSSP